MKPRFRLRSYFIPRVLPLLLTFVFLFSISAPAAFSFIKMKELRERGENLSLQVSNFLRREAYANPVLWKYDTSKLLGHIQDVSFQPQLAGIIVEDERGKPVNEAAGDRLEALRSPSILWSSSPLAIGGRTHGKVFVGFDSRDIRRTSLLLILPFLVFGFLLSGGIAFYTIRILDRSQEEIDRLFDETAVKGKQLDDLNRNLELEVKRKTEELRKACGEIEQARGDLARIATKSSLLQEEERKSTARELHDSLGQVMTAIRIDLELLSGPSAGEDERRRALAGCIRRVDESLDELRKIVERMRPPILDCAGLRSAIEKVVETFEETTGVPVEKRVDISEGGIAPAVEIACYRIVQEGFTNITRHAKAKTVELAVGTRDGLLAIDICDDGVGFDAASAAANGGSGLAGIRERAELLGGNARWETAPGRGCRLTVALPIRHAGGD
jgi:signal transduction histidine kinase